MVVTWLRNSMEDIVNLDVVFLKTAKEIQNLKKFMEIRKISLECLNWDENLVPLKQEDMYVSDYYCKFQGTLDSLMSTNPW